jgi:hypothetical protein
MTVLLDLYNLLEGLEAEKRMPALEKKDKETWGDDIMRIPAKITPAKKNDVSK